MGLNTLLLFDEALMFQVLPILMLWECKKSNLNFVLQRANNHAISQTKSCAGE